MESGVLELSSAFLHLPTPAAPTKVVWLGQRVQPNASPGQLEACTGCCRNTVLKGMAQVKGLRFPSGGPNLKMPSALLAERCVRAHAKLLYLWLQTLPTYRGMRGQFTHALLAALTGLTPRTIRRCLQELEGAGWVRLRQKNRQNPIHFRLGTPQQRRSEAEATVALRRLKRGDNRGEAIMQEFLSLMVAADDFADNDRPGFLISPLTQERLEFDRFYRAARVAFEFHGEQHDRASQRFTQREVDEQRLRDVIKAGLCFYAGIHLVVVRAEDLVLSRMIAKVGNHLPLRDLTGQERLIGVLEDAGRTYLAAAQRRGRRSS